MASPERCNHPMTTLDIRNAQWADIQEYVSRCRAEALNAWRQYGPGTTREVAALAGIDILTFRPRTTELCHVALVELVDRRGCQGIYKAVPEAEAEAAFEKARSAALAISAAAPAVFGLQDPEASN
jgi:hypothetical protein